MTTTRWGLAAASARLRKKVQETMARKASAPARGSEDRAATAQLAPSAAGALKKGSWAEEVSRLVHCEPEDLSVARVPDGSDNWEIVETATPGASNGGR